jgi:hypothetical protein
MKCPSPNKRSHKLIPVLHYTQIEDILYGFLLSDICSIQLVDMVYLFARLNEPKKKKNLINAR